MDKEEEGTAKTPKNKNIEEMGQIIQVEDVKGKNKHMKVKGPTFEVKEYDFS